MNGRIVRWSSVGIALFVVGILWLWWAYVVGSVGDDAGTNSSVWLRIAGGVALLICGLSIWFIWRVPRP